MDKNQIASETIARASFSGFVTDIDSVRIAFLAESIPEIMGEQIAMNNAVSEPQAYNYIAKGATTSLIPDDVKEYTWLSRLQAASIPCTRIEKESALEALDIKLPERTINTWGATGVEMSYFITNKGDIFVWPPYARADDGLFYVNDRVTVKTPAGVEISTDDEADMYVDGFEFVVNGVTIKVSNKKENTDNILKGDITAEELKNMASIYYKDEKGAGAPKGIESKFIYDVRTGSKPSKILGADYVVPSYVVPNYDKQETVIGADFRGFGEDIDSVRTAFITENITELMAEQIANNKAVIEEQAYNYLAKGGTTSLISDEVKEYTWLSRLQARAIPCTKIEKEAALEAIGIELPVRTVHTYAATTIEISYFISNNGYVFVWPPFFRADDGLFYINESICVTTPEGNIISGDDEHLMYEDGFEFDVRGVTIKVSNKSENVDNILRGNITPEELKNMASIYYKDKRGAKAPKGIESNFIYDSKTGNNQSKILSVAKD